MPLNQFDFFGFAHIAVMGVILAVPTDAGEQLYVSLPTARYKIAFFLFTLVVVSLIP